MRRIYVAAGVTALAALGFMLPVGSVVADAPSFPVYDGAMTFPDIDGPGGPEEFSWEVELDKGQALEPVNDQLVRVYYTDAPDQTAFSIVPVPAHDAVGRTVPTSLEVSAGNVITLTVHHRDGNPAAGGAPFDYPVIAGEGWEGGFVTEVVPGPKDEQQLREERERKAREEREAAESVHNDLQCLVPRLKGRRLRRSRKELREAGCTIGRVTIRKWASAKTGQVVRQSPKPGALLEPGAQIDVMLGRRGSRA